MKITFIGHSTCIPDVGFEMACSLIDGKHLIDAGWCGALTMRRYGFDPLDIQDVLLTHLHQDHYMGLPGILFYAGLRGRGDRPPLRVAGPGEYLEQVVSASLDFLQIPRFPEIHPGHQLLPLKPGDRFEMGGLQVETFAARHVSGHDRHEPALAYRVTDAAGASVVVSGDTHPHPPLAGFARGADLLVHDGAHTPARDAAAVARKAGVGRLLLIHYTQGAAQRILAEAREVFPNTGLAEEGQTIELSRTSPS